jgi:hypothetical protein
MATLWKNMDCAPRDEDVLVMTEGGPVVAYRIGIPQIWRDKSSHDCIVPLAWCRIPWHPVAAQAKRHQEHIE